MKRNIAFLIFFFFSNFLFGQGLTTDKKLEVNAECRIEGNNYDNILISVGNEIDTLMFKSNTAKFLLDFNKEYFIRFQKAGMETKIVKISTMNIPIDRWNMGMNPIYFMVELFPSSDNENFERLVAGYRFRESSDDFVYETLYHTLKKDISKINDSNFFVEEIDYKNRVIIRGHLSSVDPEIKNGEFRFYNEKGELEAIGEYLENLPSGIWNYYDKNGEITKRIDYEKTLAFLINDTLNYPDTINSSFKKNPKFQDEKSNTFSTYIEDNLQYPIYPFKKNISDKVLISFVIDKDGNTRNLRIISSCGNLDLNMEALRLISESPKWIPGEYNKKKIPVSITIPVLFEGK